jgi:hypothetical protein
MGRLVRVSRLGEEKATYRWLEATGESNRARDSYEQAVSELDAITGWKASNPSGGLNVDHYLAALDLEAGAVRLAESREADLRESERQTDEARVRLESATATLKGAERRDSRQRKHAQEAADKKAFDDVRDLWIVRTEATRE